jgi:hypothetical protein
MTLLRSRCRMWVTGVMSRRADVVLSGLGLSRLGVRRVPGC